MASFPPEGSISQTKELKSCLSQNEAGNRRWRTGRLLCISLQPPHPPGTADFRPGFEQEVHVALNGEQKHNFFPFLCSSIPLRTQAVGPFPPPSHLWKGGLT